MKKLLVAMVIAVGGLSLVVTDADARRLGGGGSFGKQSQMFKRAPSTQPGQNQPAATNQARQQSGQAANAAGATRPASPWRNLLGGALLGLGLGALLAHLGIGGALANIIATVLTIALIALAVMFIVRLLRGKSATPALAGHYGSAGAPTPGIGSRLEPGTRPAAFQGDALGGAVAPAGEIPADFDVPAFVRHAKTYFLRLQAAWDRGDISDIREFTTPEMFAELRMQLQERSATPNHTDVATLDAEVLGIETSDDTHLVSVRFSGLISEQEGAQPEPFTEIWNLTKPVTGGGGWLLAGIQQVS